MINQINYLVYKQQLYGEAGRLHREPFVKIMRHVMKLKSNDINELFYTLDAKNIGSISFDDFHEATSNNPKYESLYRPNRNFRQKDSR